MKEFIRQTWFYRWFIAYQQRAAYRAWEQAGRKAGAPHLHKQRLIKGYAQQQGLQTFVETGTYRGDMVEAVKHNFTKLYSIELSPTLQQRAVQRFARDKHIQILAGDSAQVLPTVLDQIKQPALFWLDGHFSEGMTAKGDTNTPVRQELTHIFKHPVQGHVILIDDARAFNGQHDYPTLPELEAYLKGLGHTAGFKVEHDIIHIVQA